MPGPLGEETIGERLQRLRTELVRVRATLARHENNGASHNIGGAAFVTEIAYEKAQIRQRKLEEQISALENRLNGTAARSGIAYTNTVMDA